MSILRRFGSWLQKKVGWTHVGSPNVIGKTEDKKACCTCEHFSYSRYRYDYDFLDDSEMVYLCGKPKKVNQKFDPILGVQRKEVYVACKSKNRWLNCKDHKELSK